MRYARTSNRLYVEDGCASVADLVAFRTTDRGIAEGPIYHFDPVKFLHAVPRPVCPISHYNTTVVVLLLLYCIISALTIDKTGFW